MTSIADLLKGMYWSIRKDWRVWPHLLKVIASGLLNFVLFRLRTVWRGAPLAIGLVEHLGDIVAAEPVARYARQQYPGSKIVWVTRRPYASVAAGFASVDAVVGVTCLTEWLLLQACGLGKPSWDLHINRRYCPKCQIPVVKAGPATAITLDNFYVHGNLLRAQCLSANLPVLTDGPMLAVDDQAVTMITTLQLPAQFFVVHCVSNEANRNWLPERWSVLLCQLLIIYPDVSIIEIGLHAAAITQDKARQRSLCGLLSVKETAEVLRKAILFIGIDSGPAHLANAVRTPGVILLAAYRGLPDYMPYSGWYADGHGAEIVRTTGDMTTHSVDLVLSAVVRRLGRL